MDIANRTIPEIKHVLDALPLEERVEFFSALESDRRAGVRALLASYRAQLARREAEERFQEAFLKYERKLYEQGFELVAGVDEAGRGALAGPLVAAAVVLPRGVGIPGVRDSKVLTPEQRDALYDRILEVAVASRTVRIEHTQIDAHGIQWANLQALGRALLELVPAPEYALSDAFTIAGLSIPHLALIKGDAKSLSIASASILAKVTRDRIMLAYHDEYPQYGFDQHKGYGTEHHKHMLERHGVSPIHRRCFAPVTSVIEHEQLGF